MSNSFGLSPVLLAIILGCCSTSSAVGQPAGDPSKELADGLLELLNEPSAADAIAEPGSSPKAAGQRDPQTLGTLNERVDPLDGLRQQMAIAADLLGRGRTDRETQLVQNEVLKQLDELIAGMESSAQNQAQNDSQNPEPQAGQTSEASGSTNSASLPQPGEPPTSGTSAGTDKSGDATRSTQPGQSGAAAQAVVKMVDPRELQQSVWGQLPERMRKQMQSRMVEQFLPSYREEIEGYFQALLSEPVYARPGDNLRQ